MTVEMQQIGQPGLSRKPLLIEGWTRCDCGCGMPDRIEFTLGGNKISISNPEHIDRVIAMLQDIRKKLWGEP